MDARTLVEREIQQYKSGFVEINGIVFDQVAGVKMSKKEAYERINRYIRNMHDVAIKNNRQDITDYMKIYYREIIKEEV